jgi:hypothetical protein
MIKNRKEEIEKCTGGEMGYFFYICLFSFKYCTSGSGLKLTLSGHSLQSLPFFGITETIHHHIYISLYHLFQKHRYRSRLIPTKPWQLKVCSYIHHMHSLVSKPRITSFNYYTDRLCGLVVRVPGYTTEMYCASCEVRTEFIYVM